MLALKYASPVVVNTDTALVSIFSYLKLRSIVKLLKGYADTQNFNLGRAAHAQLILANRATDEDVTTNNSLVQLYAKCGEISFARKVFDGMLVRNVVSWSTIMSAYLHVGCVFEAFKLFKEMVSVNNDSLRPNEYVLATLLSCVSQTRTIMEGKQLHGYVLKTGLVFYQYVKNALVHLYSRCADMGQAFGVLSSVPGLDAVSYNSVINGLVEHGYLAEALKALVRMVGENVVWDSISYVTVFSLCSHLKDLKLGSQVHGRILKDNVDINVFVGTAMIDMYGKCNEITSAKKVFFNIQTQNVFSWTAMVDAYFQIGCFEESLNLFIYMLAEDVRPNEYTFAVLLNSCAGLSSLGYGNALHSLIEKSGYKDDVCVGNTLICMYTKSGDVDSAAKMFGGMVQMDVVTWNMMINGYCQHGLGREALAVFHQMLTTQHHPTAITFVGALSACGHLGHVREGFYYLNQLMKQMGVEPGLEHYTCIIGLLSKAGQLDKAERFMSSLPVVWDVVAWRILLNACHVHRNYDLGKRVAEHILQLNPNDVGTYLLLSNMHAKANRWDGVSDIRKLMRERNVKKEPGASWIEIQNTTHVFISEDNKHPEYAKIREKVNELLTSIKQIGYVPDTSAVLHDVEDEHKDYYLSFHSEKLAVAYALLKTPPVAPIRIIKNLRICDDCHAAMKLIAKITERKIIVRDSSRFHCFRDGLCSCTDYW
uniref:DYW domain-containing protein n=1 Tax=Kalanchoe fedtschenkoi TaxID=63787 RepID=A0A7N0U079_KALFE